MAKKKLAKPGRKAEYVLQVRLNKEEYDALEEIVAKERRPKTAVVKWAIYLYSQDHGGSFPPDGKYIV